MVDSMRCLVDSMIRHIGQTVTIFTTSGGLSGNGFSGVLLSADCDCIRLLADIGAPPACPIGSCCDGCLCGRCDRCTGGIVEGCGHGHSHGHGQGHTGRRGWGWNNSWRGGRTGWRGFNWLGSIAEIPVDKIVSFTHNAL